MRSKIIELPLRRILCVIEADMKPEILVRGLLCLALWVLSVHAQISSPSSSTVWTQGGTGTITWQGIPGPPLCIVLTRVNTAFHNTITCTAQNSGTLSWTVSIPAVDGWPTSSSTDLVYRLDFYTGGGWNLGGQLVASSSQFAIVYTGVNNNPPGPGITTVIIQPTPGASFITTTKTQVIVGVITTTQYITEVVQVSYVTPSTGTVVVIQQPTVGIVTITITNTAQLSTITQMQTTGVNTVTTTTTLVGATTITGQRTAQVQLFNSGAEKGDVALSVAVMMLLALTSVMLMWG